MKLFQILLAAILCFLIAGCSLFPHSDDSTGPADVEETEPDYQVYTVASSSAEPFNYNLTLPGSRDVYFIFTNPTNTTMALPEVVDLSIHSKSDSLMSEPVTTWQKNSDSSGNSTSDRLGVIKESPWINEWNEYLRKNPIPLVLKSANNKSGGGIQPQFDVVGEPGHQLYGSEGDYMPATCRLVRTVGTAFGPKTLNIWVADNCWEVGGDRAYNVTQEMVKALADRFLNDSDRTDDDIYDWVTNLYGEEWTEYSSETVIPESDEITIFLYDIGNDNSTNGGFYGGFSSKNNYLVNLDDYRKFSNERIMFYLDAVMFATPQDRDSNVWYSTDYWPQTLFSALAHEFQHMINFNINVIEKGKPYTEAWLNEMMSLCTEDILADKIGVRGPRGVDCNDFTAGQSGNPYGRIPLHIYWPEYPLLNWPYSMDSDYDWTAYSNKYAFGAYLMRNTNPATFLNKLMNSDFSGYEALEDAIPGDELIGEMYAKSGVANIISDLKTNLSDDAGYVLNTGNWNSESYGKAGIIYRLGSINMYNYHYYDKNFKVDQQGPFFFTTSPVGKEGKYSEFQPLSNYYYKVGEGLSGKITRQITIQPGAILTVVVKK